MKVYATDEWGAVRVFNGSLGTKQAKGIVLHHFGGPAGRPAPNRKVFEDDPGFELDKAMQIGRQVQTEHRVRRGWRDTGYHFVVTRGGIILEGRWGSLAHAERGEVLYGAHCGVTQYNATYWGVSLEGDYRADLPTKKQWDAAVELCAQLSLWGGTQAKEILGHRDVKATECPGQRLYARLEQFREEVRRRKLALQGVK